MTDLAAIRKRHAGDVHTGLPVAATDQHRQAHADRGALLAALDALTAEHAALTEAHARQEWTIRTYHAERARLDAVTVAEVAEVLWQEQRKPLHKRAFVYATPLGPVHTAMAVAVLALIRAKVNP